MANDVYLDILAKNFTTTSSDDKKYEYFISGFVASAWFNAQMFINYEVKSYDDVKQLQEECRIKYSGDVMIIYFKLLQVIEDDEKE